jgi:hypothetical protein
MIDLLKLVIFLLGYVVLMRWVLPRLGVPTCLSGPCGGAAQRKRSMEQESEHASSGCCKPTPES